jgi:predicted enzyme related to lactoylglutathione lyase
VATKKTKRGGASARSTKAARKQASSGARSRKPAASASKARPPARGPAKPASRPAKAPAAKKPAPKPAAPPVAAPPPVPNAMGLLSLHFDYTTHNFEEVRRFYTQQLGFTKFDFDPSMNYLFVQTTNGSSVGFSPPMPQAGQPMMPREPILYFIVKDVDEAYRKLQTRGVSFEGPPEDKPWGHRIVVTRDPEGRSIWLAERKQTMGG